MRPTLALIAALMLAALSIPGGAEPYRYNCRLMNEATDWLFRQHCKTENFSRLAVDEKFVVHRRPPKDKKHPSLKTRVVKLYYLKKKLISKIYADCKGNPTCIKQKKKALLAKLHSKPGYSDHTASTGETGALGSSSIGSTTTSLGNTVQGAASDAVNTAGRLLGRF
jgi:hypothetical protein